MWGKRKKEKYTDRTYDFEGRCTICSKSLKLLLTKKTNHKIELEVVPCPSHPKGSHILWPQRDDIEVK